MNMNSQNNLLKLMILTTIQTKINIGILRLICSSFKNERLKVLKEIWRKII